MIPALTKKVWWSYLEEDLQELLSEAYFLAELAEKWEDPSTGSGRRRFHDYAFVVFPASKAYEGFLKKLFVDMGLITQDDYFGKHFRIGKSLNPTLPLKYRNDSWVYAKLVDFCKGKNLPDFLWETWKDCRNLVFHWFPDEKRAVTLDQARLKLQKIVAAIDMAYSTCKIN